MLACCRACPRPTCPVADLLCHESRAVVSLGVDLPSVYREAAGDRHLSLLQSAADGLHEDGLARAGCADERRHATARHVPAHVLQQVNADDADAAAVADDADIPECQQDPRRGWVREGRVVGRRLQSTRFLCVRAGVQAHDLRRRLAGQPTPLGRTRRHTSGCTVYGWSCGRWLDCAGRAGPLSRLLAVRGFARRPGAPPLWKTSEPAGKEREEEECVV